MHNWISLISGETFCSNCHHKLIHFPYEKEYLCLFDRVKSCFVKEQEVLVS